MFFCFLSYVTLYKERFLLFEIFKLLHLQIFKLFFVQNKGVEPT